MARGGRVSAGPASTGVVCPECAHVVTSADSVPRGPFFRDPRRWLPALVVVLMVLGQVGSTRPAQYPDSNTGVWIPTEGVTVEHVLAVGDGLTEPSQPLVDAVSRIANYDNSADPASRLTLSGFSAASFERLPDLRGHKYGWPFHSATSVDATEPYIALTPTALLEANSRRLGIATRPSLTDEASREYWVSWEGLLVNSACALGFASILRILLLRSRALPCRTRNRWYWRVLTLALICAFELAPVQCSIEGFWPVAGRAILAGSYTREQVRTALTLHEARALASAPGGVAALCKTLSAAPEGRAISGKTTATLQFQPTTPSRTSEWHTGWPSSFATLRWRSNSAPSGVPSRKGALGGDFTPWGASLLLNAGAWPGTEVKVSIWWHTLAVLVSGLLYAFLVVGGVTRFLWGRRTRRRFARGLCVKCGYDLRGLKAPAK